MKVNTQTIASILAFFIGYELLLPTSTENIVWYKGPAFNPPYLISRMEIIKGFFLKDLISLLYLIVSSFNYFSFRYSPILRRIIVIYLSLAFYGLLIASYSGHIYDVFENLRLIIIVFTLVCLYNSERTQTLLAFAIGLIVSGAMNLYISYTFDLFGMKPLFFLVNQNGPGPIAALLLHLSFSCRKNSWFYKLFDAVLVLIAILSLSKIAYLIFILYLVRYIRKNRSRYRKQIVIAIVLFGGVFGSVILPIYQVKFSRGFSLIDREGGDQIRLAYYKAQIEILSKKPLGVSYSGFYDEILNTAGYKKGIITETDRERANSHSTLLYYISSHGLFGFAILCYFIWIIYISDYRSKNLYTSLSLGIYICTIPFFFVSYFFVLPFILLNKE